MKADQKVIALQVVHHDGAILTATENGYGKRTKVEDYRTSGRGGSGVISIQVTERNGNVVSAEQVLDTDDVMLITDGGTLVRTHVNEVSIVGRNTQGVRLINLNEGEHLVSTTKIAEIESAEIDLGDSVE
jgi:DNA gyrase subunit A